MKTTRITISTILIALASVTLGQQGFIKERIFSGSVRQTNYISNNYEYAALPASHTFYTTGTACIWEYDAGIENWMTVPFENTVLEEGLAVEDWMTTLFENQVVEKDIVVEKWMTTPFEYETVEEDLCLESWMTTPFEAQEDKWMFAAAEE